MANRTTLVAEGNTYLSVAEAATCLGVNQNVIQDRLRYNTYAPATREQVLAELVRRGWSTDKEQAIRNFPTTRTTRGIPRPIIANGKYFPTIADAARDEGITPQALKKNY